MRASVLGPAGRSGRLRPTSAKGHSAALALAVLLAGCVPSTTERPPAMQEPARQVPTAEPILGNVVGRTARALEAQFGKPDLDVREGTARKLQFASPVCVLDTYLYPRRGGGEAVVTYVDARLPDGRDMDRASCIAALSRRQQAR
ncbi:hypothetical protein [Sphingosinicella rhizophila]|uniref:Lipoprotein n=1 Tax=Sphingosinicella rhizophila TaxID=3050082 RepID=A0ABU3Q747_9SPHN|nr:hypothetical protein [Sphingosinicella sp. GR2756]MDT9599216.1 hypothetical protein [Sphingosinicella sp. GR2756]